MPWVANNNQAGEFRAPTRAVVQSKEEEKQQKVRLRTVRSDHSQPLARLHPTTFAAFGGAEFLYVRAHAQFVVKARGDQTMQVGHIGLSDRQLRNLELCDGGEEELWTAYVDNQTLPDATSLTIEVVSSVEEVTLSAQQIAAAFCAFTWQLIVTEGEAFQMTFQGVELFIRITEIEAEDANENEFMMADVFRGMVTEETVAYVTTSHKSLTLTDVVLKEASPPHPDVVNVWTNDDEMFPVKKKLLFPCISLTSAVLSGKGVHKDASNDIKVDVDCCTFDRVLLYLEFEARNEGPSFNFDPHYTEEMLCAAKKLGCAGLEELCEKKLGEFATRVLPDFIRWEEVVARNTQHGEIWLVMDGMVFNVTRWLPEHPGGSVIIPREALNMDCTVFFEIYHASRQSFRYLKQFYIGELDPSDRESKVPPHPTNQKPSAGFLQELRQYTTWRVQPKETLHKSF